jgi:hypothetical protein
VDVETQKVKTLRRKAEYGETALPVFRLVGRCLRDINSHWDRRGVMCQRSRKEPGENLGAWITGVVITPVETE